MRHPIRPVVVLTILTMAFTLSACGISSSDPTSTQSSLTTSPPLPTPFEETLRVNAVTQDNARLRVTIPALRFLARSPGESVQLLIVLADRAGGYSFLLHPANQTGIMADQVDLSSYPLEINLSNDTEQISLWVLALHNMRYQAAENFGVDSLVATLAQSYKNWLVTGNQTDDPLAAIVANSDGALFEWFAAVDVLGQTIIDFSVGDPWNRLLQSVSSDDGGLNMVYSSDVISNTADNTPTPTPTSMITQSVATSIPATPVSTDPGLPSYRLSVNETFETESPSINWFQEEGETYVNRITDGAYQIKLTAIREREFSQSWGSIENEAFANYRLEAEVQIVESDISDGRTGIWFNYQDDFNFLYFGISNKGEYRVALIARNQTVTEFQNWTSHPAITPGSAVNVLTVESRDDGTVTLSANGTELMSFKESTFSRGSVAFFCYAKSVPATCRLNNLKIWEEVQ